MSEALKLMQGKFKHLENIHAGPGWRFEIAFSSMDMVDAKTASPNEGNRALEMARQAAREGKSIRLLVEVVDP